MIRIDHLASLRDRVGQELAVGEWVVVDQPMIDKFAEATGDHQWIHVDPERAAAGPFGATVAHGYLTLSLVPALAAGAFEIADVRMAINYGLDRVRFPAPVRVGSRLRGRFVLTDYTPIDGGAQLTVRCTMELEGSDKPACVADALSRRFT